MKKDNILVTHWEKDEFDLSRGLDFAPRGSLKARFTHLQHRKFTYNISVRFYHGTAIGTTDFLLSGLSQILRYRFKII